MEKDKTDDFEIFNAEEIKDAQELGDAMIETKEVPKY